MNAKDRLFDGEIIRAGDFVFDERVVSVFPDMINRSVPGYAMIVPMLAMLARRYAMADSRLYDLGCSLGAVSLAMRQTVTAPRARILAIDNSPEMVTQLRKILAAEEQPGLPPVEVLQRDIRDVLIEDASVVVLNFTLQFIEPPERGPLLAGIARGMRAGGVLLLSEKIRFDDPREQELQVEWHHDFKRAQGYSELEIARKRDALENVMKPETLQRHRERLRQAGFQNVYRWYQGFNFVSLAAFR